MARVDYCKHNNYTGHGENYQPCSQCEKELKDRVARQVAAKEHLRSEIREVLAEDLRKAIADQNKRFDAECLKQVTYAILGNYEAQVMRGDDGYFHLYTHAGTLSRAIPFANRKDGKSSYSWNTFDEAVSDWYVHFGEGKLSPDYGLFHEFREDGWPLCPKCGEDELSSPTAWNGTGEKPPIIAFVHAGMLCLKCGFEVEREDWEAK